MPTARRVPQPSQRIDWTENPASAHVRITGLGRTSWL